MCVGVCMNVQLYAQVCGCVWMYAGVCRSVYSCADVCGCVQVYTDVCTGVPVCVWSYKTCRCAKTRAPHIHTCKPRQDSQRQRLRPFLRASELDTRCQAKESNPALLGPPCSKVESPGEKYRTSSPELMGGWSWNFGSHCAKV